MFERCEREEKLEGSGGRSSAQTLTGRRDTESSVSWLLLLWLAKEIQFKLASPARMTRSASLGKAESPSGTPGDEDERSSRLEMSGARGWTRA